MWARRCALLCALALLVAGALAAPAFATFGGSNGRISFFRFVEETNSGEIFSAAPDGTDVQQLTSNPDRFSQFSDWSPNGQEIAFDSDRVDQDGRDDVVQVYTMPWNGETFGLTQLTVGPGFHGDPGYSPDGSRIAIDADWGDYPALQGIWTIASSDPDGVTQDEAERVTTIPAGADFDSEPQYSPDGAWIVFTRFKSCLFHERGHLEGFTYGCTSAIYKVRTEGTDLQRLTAWGLNASAPDWSPSGRLIAYDASDNIAPGERGDIHVMRPDGSGKTTLTDNPTIRNAGHDLENFAVDFANNPVWSPDATKIAFARWPPTGPGVIDISTINSDGSGATTLVDGDFFQNKPDWGTHP
jgi:Tol biopolymer transport system component